MKRRELPGKCRAEASPEERMTKPEFIRASKPPYKARYGNFIGGRFVEPVGGRYFENTSPVNGQGCARSPVRGRRTSRRRWTRRMRRRRPGGGRARRSGR